MERGQIVLVDTNIIIEAFRTRCWNALTAFYRMETVEKCREEAHTGNARRPDYVQVDGQALRANLMVYPVSDLELAVLSLSLSQADALDAGERHLFAHALGRTDDWLAACADRAAVNVALALGWADKIVSLEALVPPTGARPQLKRHFQEEWLAEVRTEYLLARGLS